MAFSAFFSGMEIAFVSSNKLRFEMDKNNSLSTKALSVFYRNPNNFISTMLVGNNISLVIYGIWMAQLIEQYVLIDVIQNEAALVFIETIISTAIILVTGEFMPKTLFKINPNATLKIFAVPSFLCYIILYPFSKFASSISAGLLWLTGNPVNKEVSEKAFTKVDLDHFIQSSINESGNKEQLETEVEIFKNALDFSNIKIRDCMIPRTEIIAVEENTSLEALNAVFIKNGISKIIVYRENIDNITGYIHSSEMFRTSDEWQKHIRSIPIVPETMSAHKLMKRLMQQKRSLAAVVDEFGGTAGIVSMEDLVEEIFGDIEDEHDTNSVIARKINENEYVFSGRLDIEKANEDFHLNLPESDEYQTVGGLILHTYQGFPKPQETIDVQKFRFTIIRVTATKIELVKMKLMES